MFGFKQRTISDFIEDGYKVDVLISKDGGETWEVCEEPNMSLNERRHYIEASIAQERRRLLNGIRKRRKSKKHPQ